MAITYECEICGESKTVPLSTYKRGHRFCSQKCSGIDKSNKYGGLKRCSQCKEKKERSLEYFYRNKNKSDNLSTECKECCRANTERRHAERKRFIIDRGLACESCGLEDKDVSFFEVDHIIPRKMTGEKIQWYSYDNDNLQVLCPNCHKRKTINERTKK